MKYGAISQRGGVHRGSLLAPGFFGDPLLYPSTHADAACHRHMETLPAVLGAGGTSSIRTF